MILLLATLVLASTARAADANGAEVARVDGASLHCESTAPALQRCAADLLRSIRTRAARDYVEGRGLQATDAEIERVYAYERAFRRHDRAQRERKRIELDARLAQASLSAQERARLEEFRAVLARLARYDADVDAGTEQPIELPREAAILWIEDAKLDADLYRRFGGIVGVRSAGLYAHGGRRELVVRFLSAHKIAFLDPDFEAAIQRLLNAPPKIVFRGATPDFTPFWLRPIPASYMPD